VGVVAGMVAEADGITTVVAVLEREPQSRSD
jgi:hypothetical protein